MTPADTPEGFASRAVVFVVLMLVALVLAILFRDGLAHYARGFGPALAKALGREPPPDWRSGEWICGACLSSNTRISTECAKCRGHRAMTALRPADPEPMSEVVPERIAVPAGTHLLLEHNAAAHADGLVGHWRIRRSGQVLASTSRRTGVPGMLRAIEGTDIILLDRRGAGATAYRIPEVIAEFESPRFPLAVPCPERTVGPAPD
jgi:hypothetical protein